MKKLLLHICCAPDQTVAFERTGEEFEVTGFFSNSCIEPQGEYFKRLASSRRLAEIQGIELIEDEYLPNAFLALAKGLEKEPERGRRCLKCIEYRMRRAAETAGERGFDIFATTLTVSPHKDADFINRVGAELADEFEVEYLPSNFKKQDGFKRSVELTKKLGIYRQTYCGCRFSLRDKKEREAERENAKERETDEAYKNRKFSVVDESNAFGAPPGAFFKPKDAVSRRFKQVKRRK